MNLIRQTALASLLLLSPSVASAFCGFYVAKADTKLFNKASQVAIARDDNKTVMTMANDYQGSLKEFAIVIPVPTVITRQQIHIGDKAVLDHLDAYSAPRLVEYFDDNPCERRYKEESLRMPASSPVMQDLKRSKNLGVTIEASYTIGEYDILILSAKQSGGLETWLRDSGYRIPSGATAVLESYIKQNMKFFVAKVNIKEQQKLGFTFLRPIQVAYESPKFMLPIRLGTVNANGTQELFIYTLTRGGRVETTNYRTVKLPSDMEIPTYVKNDFGAFYKAMFGRQVAKEDMHAVFLEYAWDMNWCDPCAADPLTRKELRDLGAFWLEKGAESSQAQQVFLTRLHVRYDAAHFPEDLVFHETGDKTNFQARYVLRHPFTGSANCDAARSYRSEVRERQEKEALNLARLTGWKVGDIRSRMDLIRRDPEPAEEKKWYDKIWE